MSSLIDQGDEASRSHLRIQAISVPVKDLDRSLEFYETKLAFTAVQRVETPSGVRMAFVAPPDGGALLALSEVPATESIATQSGVWFVTDDIDRQYRQWLERGVPFKGLPTVSVPTTRYATFCDPDGNSFLLVEADVITRQIEAERRRIADDAERRRLAANEIRIATQVQAGLFPRHRPSMETLDYAGVCLQARHVGGDYFDFLDFGSGRLGLVVGDVSGKGIGAALLMANLQAHIRSHYSLYVDDLPSLLTSVNRLFQDSTPPASYATLFLGVYDDRSHRLTFVNCGHPPPLVLRSDGRVEWLEATSHVLGMFDEWSGTARSVDLLPDDRVVIYTDGVTEALDHTGNEFGPAKIASVCRHVVGDAQTTLDALVGAVREFSGERQHDDITVVTGQVRTGHSAISDSAAP